MRGDYVARPLLPANLATSTTAISQLARFYDLVLQKERNYGLSSAVGIPWGTSARAIQSLTHNQGVITFSISAFNWL